MQYMVFGFSFLLCLRLRAFQLFIGIEHQKRNALISSLFCMHASCVGIVDVCRIFLLLHKVTSCDG